MRVVEVSAYGGPEVLRMAHRPEPEAGSVPGEVRVKLKATTVNQADLAIRAGAFAEVMPDLKPPFVLGFDFVGRLLDPAPGLEKGQRVAGFVPWFRRPGKGTYAEVITADPAWLAPVPDAVDVVDAASVPFSSQTAHEALEHLALPEGSVVFISGASGVVGRFAVQHAAERGLRVIALSHEGGEGELKVLGAEHTILRGEPEEIVAEVLRHSPEGVHGVFDPARIADPLMRVVRDGGVFIAGHESSVPEAERDIRAHTFATTSDGARLKEMLERLAERRLTTRVADVLPLEEAAEGHRRAEGGGRLGRIVLVM
ncbi:NADP-dependent oxidoreductase [Streptomyces sp. NPDC048604]|uniref:NADP-dependent oxidoreductase n=1 Tax=Streptomyces sp. NPDC048604 TaxID=3365578 RepID=UPI0037186D96